jgi:hypothetical protein
VTTRNAGLVHATGAAEVEVEVAELSDAQAQALAAGWAAVSEQQLPTAAGTLRLVDNLALGVATVAALARGDGQRWPELAGRLRRAELSWPRSSCGFPAIRAHPSLLAALQLGLDYLDASAGQRYRKLAARFGDRALLRRDPVTGRFDLHDLQSDLVRADLGDSLPAAHERLLATYAAQCPRGSPSGRSDGASRSSSGCMLPRGRGRAQPGCARSGPPSRSWARRSGSPLPPTPPGYRGGSQRGRGGPRSAATARSGCGTWPATGSKPAG